MLYIDDLKGMRNWPKARQKRCHLVSDNLAELHAFAKRLDIPRDAFSFPPRHEFPHYKLTSSQREEAVKLGVVQTTKEKVIEIANSCGFVLK